VLPNAVYPMSEAAGRAIWMQCARHPYCARLLETYTSTRRLTGNDDAVFVKR
jgi:hypothetical protein